MKREITKAVFPVAGMGSRFLPATKASPKEMLPVVDKPLIQYAVEEAVAAGMTEMIFVTGRNKRAIEDHFDKAAELEAALEERGNQKLLATVRGILPAGVHCVFIRQPETLGLGHAVLCARPLVGDEPFAVILADDLIDAKPSVMTQMVERYSYYRRSVIGVQNVAREDTDQYGIVRCGSALNDVHQIDGIIEKPKPAEAPSTLGVVGRYILSPRIFDHLANARPGKGGEIQLTDAIASLLKQEQVLAYQFQGTRYDCGSKIGYLKATIAFAMSHPDVSEEFIAHLRGVAASLPASERDRAAA
ncbi:MAG: UTP--glucose-1-phosphate uridylyltransferase GalU [Burkholderiales bacterium]|nr:UTP--glucose-1-phosphate uridylyltransferase GalU [Burkholderiales bacterium]